MLTPRKESYDQSRQHIEKQRCYFVQKVCLVKAMVFPVVMYGCESWTIKTAEHRRIDAFELWCWRRLLKVPWTARRANQSILKEISPEYSLDGLSWNWNSSTLATWCEELTHLKRLWSWERLMVGGEGDDRGWDGWMASPTQWTWVWVNCGSWWWTGRPGMLQSMGSQRVRHDWATEQQQSLNREEEPLALDLKLRWDCGGIWYSGDSSQWMKYGFRIWLRKRWNVVRFLVQFPLIF